VVWVRHARLATIITDSKTNRAVKGTRIWDLPTRICHWLLAACFCGSWITAEAGFDWTEVHFLFGYTTLGLVVFRILWGFAGNNHARFKSFMASPANALRALPNLADDVAERHPGHSPYGGYAVLALLYFALAQAASGLFISDDILYAGPYNPVISNDLAGSVAWYHHLNFKLFQAMVGLHLLAIVWYKWRKHESLVLPMITGKKNIAYAHTHKVSKIRALLIIAIAAVAVIFLLLLAPEPSPDDYF